VNILTNLNINGYHIGPLLGRGGMGQVYEATTPNGAAVALKLLRGEYESNIEFQSRFLREIAIMESLEHENIVPIFDAGVYGDKIYYTMPLMKSLTLTHVMKQHPFSPTGFLDTLTQLGKALAYGHARNLVHRDVKPDNIFLEPRGRTYHVRLGDYGMSKRIGTDLTLTKTDDIIGTPNYLSPEAVTGNVLDPRSDIYAVAVVVYEVLLGALPFNEKSQHLVAMAHVLNPVPEPRSLNSTFPEQLQDVLLKGLEKDADKRYQTIYDFVYAYKDAVEALSPYKRRKCYQVTR
jgi:eukaryotic-like serine/threonine-protein kinase